MGMVQTENEAIELARKIVLDIVLYNIDKVIEGIINDNLFELLEKEIQEGKDLFLSQVSPDIPMVEFIFDRIFADIILEEGKNIKSKIWE